MVEKSLCGSFFYAKQTIGAGFVPGKLPTVGAKTSI